jgi:hypothetical protein
MWLKRQGRKEHFLLGEKYWNYPATRVLEQINLLMPKSKNIYFDSAALASHRASTQDAKIMRPCFIAPPFIYGVFFPAISAPFPIF